MLVNDLKTT
jgi:chromosome segregation ATPase